MSDIEWPPLASVFRPIDNGGAVIAQLQQDLAERQAWGEEGWRNALIYAATIEQLRERITRLQGAVAEARGWTPA